MASKDTEAGGGLNLAIKRAEPNKAIPNSSASPKSPEENTSKKSDKKTKGKNTQDKQNSLTGQTAVAVDRNKEQSTSKSDN